MGDLRALQDEQGPIINTIGPLLTRRVRLQFSIPFRAHIERKAYIERDAHALCFGMHPSLRWPRVPLSCAPTFACVCTLPGVCMYVCVCTLLDVWMGPAADGGFPDVCSVL
jgi:hypothetical protein